MIEVNSGTILQEPILWLGFYKYSRNYNFFVMAFKLLLSQSLRTLKGGILVALIYLNVASNYLDDRKMVYSCHTLRLSAKMRYISLYIFPICHTYKQADLKSI